MSFARTAGKIVGGILLTLGIMLVILSYTASDVTSYDTLKPVVSDLLVKQLLVSEVQMDQIKTLLVAQCQKTGQGVVDIPAGVFNGTLAISCSELANSTGKQVVNKLVLAMFDKLYYKDYGCDFLSCMRQLEGNDKWLVFVSSTSHAFFEMLLWLGAIAVVVGLILLIVSIQKVFSCIKAVGISMIVAGIPYFAFLTLTNVIKLPDVIMQSQNIISNALNTIMTMFLVVLILGIILAIIGVVGRHYYNEDGPKKRKK